MRKIDADAAIKRMKGTYCKGCDNDYGCRCEACWVDDAIGEIEETPTLRDWIPCSERMPEKDTSVLISAQGHRVSAFYDSVKGVFMLTETEGLFYSMSAVTHWMPIPATPEVFSNVE